jgi:hypothetical protein
MSYSPFEGGAGGCLRFLLASILFLTLPMSPPCWLIANCSTHKGCLIPPLKGCARKAWRILLDARY